MRLGDIAHVFILSCVMFTFYVSSQSSCPLGWFGLKCKYKCRCVLNSCDASGNCTGHFPCLGGWFGPACQYVDLAFEKTNVIDVGDGNEVTCLHGNVSYIQIMMKEIIAFTWLRIKVSEIGSAFLSDVSLSFFVNKAPVISSNTRKQFVDSTTLDLHCDIPEFIDQVILEGKAASYACSVYVSGGRNLAIKENTTQVSTYSEHVSSKNRNIAFSSDLAVDGNRDQHFYSGLSCTHTGSGATPQKIPMWTLTLSKPRLVNRYLIYNRQESSVNLRLKGFVLDSFNASSKKIFTYMDTNPSTKNLFSIIHKPLPVRKVAISVNNSDLRLSLCEVEVYGDSICDAEHYGRDCELDCECPHGEPCIVATGGCYDPCPAGFQGMDCLTPCSLGFYGDGCQSNCSENCSSVDDGLEDIPKSPCNHVTGVCVMGCKSGFMGLTCDIECPEGNCASACSSTCVPSDQPNKPSCNLSTGACTIGCKSGFTGLLCETGCGVGKYGRNCALTCSINCATPESTFISACIPDTGACVKGCKSGFSGETCTSESSATGDQSSGLGGVLIVGVCLVLAAAAFLGFMCTRKKTRPIEENKAAPVKPVRKEYRTSVREKRRTMSDINEVTSQY